MILVRITGGTLYTGPISQEADMTAAATLPAGIGDKVLAIIEIRCFFLIQANLSDADTTFSYQNGMASV